MLRNIIVKASEPEYWEEISRRQGSSDVFERQGEGHGSIDAALQSAIENILEPLVGPWEFSDVWYCNLDFYGNGLRYLMFQTGQFPWHAIPALQKLLKGDASQFCIAINFHDALDDLEAQSVGGLAILRDGLVVHPAIYELLQAHMPADW